MNDDDEFDEEWRPPSDGESCDDDGSDDACHAVACFDEFEEEGFVERMHASAFHAIEYASHLALQLLQQPVIRWADLLIIQEQVSSATADLIRCDKHMRELAKEKSEATLRRKLGAACFHAKRALNELMPCTLPFTWSAEDAIERRAVLLMPSLDVDSHVAKCLRCMHHVVPILDDARRILRNIQWQK